VRPLQAAVRQPGRFAERRTTSQQTGEAPRHSAPMNTKRRLALDGNHAGLRPRSCRSRDVDAPLRNAVEHASATVTPRRLAGSNGTERETGVGFPQAQAITMMTSADLVVAYALRCQRRWWIQLVGQSVEFPSPASIDHLVESVDLAVDLQDYSGPTGWPSERDKVLFDNTLQAETSARHSWPPSCPSPGRPAQG
jgi:hypothetical protein